MHTGAHTHRFPTYMLSKKKKKKSLRLVSTAYLLVGETLVLHYAHSWEKNKGKWIFFIKKQEL